MSGLLIVCEAVEDASRSPSAVPESDLQNETIHLDTTLSPRVDEQTTNRGSFSSTDTTSIVVSNDTVISPSKASKLLETSPVNGQDGTTLSVSAQDDKTNTPEVMTTTPYHIQVQDTSTQKAYDVTSDMVTKSTAGPTDNSLRLITEQSAYIETSTATQHTGNDIISSQSDNETITTDTEYIHGVLSGSASEPITSANQKTVTTSQAEVSSSVSERLEETRSVQIRTVVSGTESMSSSAVNVINRDNIVTTSVQSPHSTLSHVSQGTMSSVPPSSISSVHRILDMTSSQSQPWFSSQEVTIPTPSYSSVGASIAESPLSSVSSANSVIPVAETLTGTNTMEISPTATINQMHSSVKGTHIDNIITTESTTILSSDMHPSEAVHSLPPTLATVDAQTMASESGGIISKSMESSTSVETIPTVVISNETPSLSGEPRSLRVMMSSISEESLQTHVTESIGLSSFSQIILESQNRSPIVTHPYPSYSSVGASIAESSLSSVSSANSVIPVAETLTGTNTMEISPTATINQMHSSVKGTHIDNIITTESTITLSSDIHPSEAVHRSLPYSSMRTPTLATVDVQTIASESGGIISKSTESSTSVVETIPPVVTSYEAPSLTEVPISLIVKMSSISEQSIQTHVTESIGLSSISEIILESQTRSPTVTLELQFKSTSAVQSEGYSELQSTPVVQSVGYSQFQSGGYSKYTTTDKSSDFASRSALEDVTTTGTSEITNVTDSSSAPTGLIGTSLDDQMLHTTTSKPPDMTTNIVDVVTNSSENETWVSTVVLLLGNTERVIPNTKSSPDTASESLIAVTGKADTSPPDTTTKTYVTIHEKPKIRTSSKKPSASTKFPPKTKKPVPTIPVTKKMVSTPPTKWPSLYITFQIEMTWSEFCVLILEFKSIILKVLEKKIGTANNGFHVTILNEHECQTAKKKHWSADISVHVIITDYKGKYNMQMTDKLVDLLEDNLELPGTSFKDKVSNYIKCFVLIFRFLDKMPYFADCMPMLGFLLISNVKHPHCII